MTDTPIIALYYREHDPMKRKILLQAKMRRQMLSVRNCGNCVTENLQRQFPVHVLMGIWRFGWQWNTARIQRESCLV